MVIYCDVVGCKNLHDKRNKISFHTFPTTNKDLRQKWLRAIGKTCVSKRALVCSDHFEKSSYYNISDLSTLKRLLPTAVPHVDQEIINMTITTGQKKIDNCIGYTQSFPGSNNISLKEESEPFVPDSNNISLKEESEQSVPDSNNITIKDEFAEIHMSFTESISDDIPELIDKKDFMLNDIHEQPQDIPELNEENNLLLDNIHKHPQHFPELIEKKDFMLDDIHEQQQDIPELIEEDDLMLNNIHDHPDYKISDLPKDDFCPSPYTNSVSSHEEVDNSSSPNLLVSDYTTAENHKGLKRKKTSYYEEGNYPKKIKLYNRHFTREDFTSDAAWRYFADGIAIERAQKNSLRTQWKREQKYKEHLQNEQKNFKECVRKEAASYLEDLPELVREIVVRIKNGSPTAPCSAKLTNFALSLRSHSPAAYELVRDTFSKSLPCSKTLKRYLKKERLANSEEILPIVENESKG